MKKALLSLAIACLCMGCAKAKESPVATQGEAVSNTESVAAEGTPTNEEAAEVGTADGMMAPDFSLTDINGKTMALSSLQGKYVILDFWGSWCGWCIKGIPDMKKVYEKYNGKLEILGIDCNDTEEKWKAAVAQYEIPWKHVYNPRSSGLLKTYEIQGFPTKIIIDPKGKIVKTIIGEDPEFYTFLDKLMGE